MELSFVGSYYADWYLEINGHCLSGVAAAVERSGVSRVQSNACTNELMHN